VGGALARLTGAGTGRDKIRAPIMLNPDRYFDPAPEVRDLARELYGRAARLPLVCPHGHVDPRLLAENTPFPDPAALLVIPDHYVTRMLYSQGVPLEALGVPSLDGTPVETDSRRIWRRFAEHMPLFRGTPSGCWLRHELADVFGVDEPLSARNADAVYDRIDAQLRTASHQAITNFLKADTTLTSFITNSAGYAVFPDVGKGGFIVGGARGKGVVYEKENIIGQATMTQATVGAQVGGQSFSEIIFFETPEALNDFKTGKFEMRAEVSAVAASVAKAGSLISRSRSRISMFFGAPLRNWATKVASASGS